MKNKTKFLDFLDFEGFVSLIIATVLVIVFEFVGKVAILTVSVCFYELCAICYLIFCICKICFAYKKEENKDENLVLSKKQIGWLFGKLALSIILLCWVTVAMIFIFV